MTLHHGPRTLTNDQMTPASLLVLSEVAAPQVKLDLPRVRVGDHLNLQFRLERQQNGRSEVLDVQGEFRVTKVVLQVDGRQVVHVDAIGKAPAWRAVRKKKLPVRKLGPTRYPRTIVS